MSWDDTSHSCDTEQISSIIACVCELKETVECVAKCFGGHISSGTKSKILFCLVLQEIQNIEDLLNNKVFGLKEIKNEIRAIENAVLSPTFGLNEIKNEIRGIENTVNNFEAINITVNIINDIVAGINNTINNEVFGLNEIKNEIRAIEENTGFGTVLTTGPVITDVNAKNIMVKVLNNSQSNQLVRVKIFNIAECPKCEDIIFNTVLGPIAVGCSSETGSIDIQKVPEFEVEVSGIVPGVYVFAAANTGASSNLVSTNTFRHADFVRQVYNNC